CVAACCPAGPPACPGRQPVGFPGRRGSLSPPLSLEPGAGRRGDAGRTRIFKIIVIGDSNVGKTCLTFRFCGGTFPDKTEATIGVDFREKTVEIEGERIKVGHGGTGTAPGAGRQRPGRRRQPVPAPTPAPGPGPPNAPRGLFCSRCDPREGKRGRFLIPVLQRCLLKASPRCVVAIDAVCSGLQAV
uniref:Uncharacterized protein n=1 Tax=Accipiter nisus TaxID=211598 RepID=A0A8B9N8G9_9AVES